MRAVAPSLLLALVLAAAPLSAHAAGGGSSSAPSGPAPSAARVVTAEELQARYVKGVEALEAQDFAAAKGHFRFVTRNAPQSADAWNYLGYATRKDGDVKGGEKAYKKALKLDPNHVRANEYYGELLIEAGRMEEAAARLAVLEACCAAAPETALLKTSLEAAKAGAPQPRLKAIVRY